MKKKYAWIALILLVIEVAIASFFTTGFIRTQLGDLLVVALLYFLGRAFLPLKKGHMALIVLLFAFGVEALQAAPFLEYFGWEDQTWAKLVFGNSFQVHDLFMYAIGTSLAFTVDWWVLDTPENTGS